MNLTTIATIIGILGGGGLVGIISALIKVTMDYQKQKSKSETLEGTVTKQQIDLDAIQIEFEQLKTKFAQNEKRDEEERKENALKFNELYNSRNTTNETLARLTTTVEMLVSTMSEKFDTVYKKIDEIKKEIK